MITGLVAIIHDAVTRSLRAPMGMILLLASLLLISLVAALGISPPWIVYRMMEYSENLIQNIPQAIMGG